MFTTSATEFAREFPTLDTSFRARPTANAVFLVTPAAFSLAEESAQDNAYMQMQDKVNPMQALEQHARLATALREDCPVLTFPGDEQTPDAVFPNNVFGTSQRKLLVGAMRHAVRQREAERTDIRQFFTDVLGYDVQDLRTEPDVVAELTGCIVIDHLRGIGFIGLSERCNLAGAKAMHAAFGLRLSYAFELAPAEYHTNVVLASLAGRGVMIAPDGFADPAAATAIMAAYGKGTVRLSAAQKKAYAGNAITLSEKRVWMSAQARQSLQDEQTQQLADLGFAIGAVDLSEIEKAGGSLRCCVAEIF